MSDLALYRLAQEFKAEKLWETLYDADVFAVRLADGEDAYCSVMGMNGEHFALGVYVGVKGFSSLKRLMPRGGGMPSLRDMLSQDCLMCSFEDREEIEPRDYAEIKALGLSYRGRHAWPMFRRFKPLRLSWFLEDEGECEILKQALRATVAVSQRLRELPPGSGIEALGFGDISCPLLIPAEDGFRWETADLPKEQIFGVQMQLSDDLEIARLKRKKTRHGERLLLDMLPPPMPVDGEPPYFPEIFVMLLPDGAVKNAAVVEDFEEDAGEILSAFLDHISEAGKPGLVCMRDVRLYMLLGGIAGQIGLSLELREEIPELEEIERDMQGYLASGGEEEEPTDMESRTQENLSLLQSMIPEDPAERRGMLSALLGELREGESPEDREAVPNGLLSPPPSRRRKDARGVCALCGKEYKKSGMLRHLEACAARDHKSGGETYFILKIEDTYRPEYFLYLEIAASARLNEVDTFLRDIWVECCGHMSAFIVNGESYVSHAGTGGRSMRAKLSDVLQEGAAFRYEYDFGSTTELLLTVSKSFTAAQRKDKLRLLARNSPPEIVCIACGKPAATVCADCGGLDTPYCDECGPKHKCGGEGLMPLVNSPRCGVCGYGME